MPTQQQQGCRWVIKDPDGIVVEEYPGGGNIDWEFGYTGPGDEQDFIGGRFDFNKVGAYTLKAELFMNPSSPIVVDSYDGDLCTVSTEVPLEYTCPFCGTTFATQEELEAHIKAEHPEEVGKFPWVLAAVIGGGAVLAIAVMKPKKKIRKE